jgi:hypothetical protein
MSESDMEAPTADSVEQRQSVADDAGEPLDDEPAELPLDVNEADAAEQLRTVELDEDDYR